MKSDADVLGAVVANINENFISPTKGPHAGDEVTDIAMEGRRKKRRRGGSVGGLRCSLLYRKFMDTPANVKKSCEVEQKEMEIYSYEGGSINNVILYCHQ